MLALTALCAAPALADRERAKALFDEGSAAYQVGDFGLAAERYKAAYQEEAIPAFLFNIAQAFFQAEDYKQATFFYRAYLRERPDARNRALVQERIAESERLYAAQLAASEAEAAAQRAAAEAEQRLGEAARLASEQAAAKAKAALEEQRRLKEEAKARTAELQRQTAEAQRQRAEEERKAKEAEAARAEAEATVPLWEQTWFWPTVGVSAGALATVAVAATLTGTGVYLVASPPPYSLPTGEIE